MRIRMRSAHEILEAALDCENPTEADRKSLRSEMGEAMIVLSFEIMDLCETHEGTDVPTELEEVDLEALDEILSEAGLHLEKDPDLWMVRDERGDVVCGVSADTAMRETIERLARGHLAARKEIEHREGVGDV